MGRGRCGHSMHSPTLRRRDQQAVTMERIWLNHYPPGVPAEIDLPDEPLSAMFARAARKGGKRVALREVEERALAAPGVRDAAARALIERDRRAR